jgi:hypothetical protein
MAIVRGMAKKKLMGCNVLMNTGGPMVKEIGSRG